jgi:hypothetical protein
MRFDARDLTSYARPIETNALVQGEMYLSIQYVDEALLIPTIETMVFVGRNLEPNDTDFLYFQDVECYLKGMKYGSYPLKEIGFRPFQEQGVKHIFEYESALDELMKCSLRRRAAKNKLGRLDDPNKP